MAAFRFDFVLSTTLGIVRTVHRRIGHSPMQMADALHVFDYRVFGTRKRRRSPAWHIVRETFSMPIPRYAAPDALIAVGSNEHERGNTFSLVGRRLYMPIHTHSRTPLAIRESDSPFGKDSRRSHEEQVRDFVRRSDLTFSPWITPYATTDETSSVKDWDPEIRDSFAGDGSDIRDILETDREARLALARVDAANLCYVDGDLHTSRYEPTITGATGKEVIYWSDTFDIRREHREVFDIESARTRLGNDGEPRSGRSFIGEHLVNREIEWHFPTRVHNARICLRECISTVFDPDRKSVRLGEGFACRPDVSADLDEAAFDLRSSLRDLSVDLRGEAPSDAAMRLAGGRLERFSEVFERESSLLAGHRGSGFSALANWAKEMSIELRTDGTRPARKVMP